jgi:hypothetical protein
VFGFVVGCQDPGVLPPKTPGNPQETTGNRIAPWLGKSEHPARFVLAITSL